MSAEATVVRNYLDWLLSIPWQRRSKIKKDLPAAQAILDADHFGLDKVKERIVEYLAVQQRANKLTGPILCLVGPPGVGKTSLGKSIAKATGREFVRMSLGGVRDEAEIRGHRRTYIGSMPGKVIQSMRKAKTSNPLFLLDEIDKMGMDFRGDPSSALLEVLDPEQNATFNDHYLEVDYDLSGVMFVTTANTLNIPAAADGPDGDHPHRRLHEDEKLEIAKRHLLPNSMGKHGLDAKRIRGRGQRAMELIRRYTREAGVRNLEREISNLARKAVKDILTNKKKKIVVTADNVAEFLGPPKFRFGEIEADDQVGLVTGLAWTEVGGELLTIEGVDDAGQGPHDGDRQPEGRDEGVDLGRGVLRALAGGRFRHRAAAVRQARHPRPRPGGRDARRTDRRRASAMATVIVSMLTGIPVRHDIAMTGEITLRGRVLPIGGLKEKLLAALRGGIKKVLIPEENVKDLVGHSELGEERPRDRAGRAHGGGAAARARAASRCRSSGRRRPTRSRRGRLLRRRRPGPRRPLTIAWRRSQGRLPRRSAKTPQIPGVCGVFVAETAISAAQHIFFCGLLPLTLDFLGRT